MTKRIKSKSGILVVLFVSLLSTSLVLPYSRPRFNVCSTIQQSRWPAGPVPVVVNVDSPNSIVPGSQPFEAVRNGLETYSAYSGIRFAPQVGSFPVEFGQDSTNLITFVDTPTNRSVVAGHFVIVQFWYNVVNCEPVLTESDMAFSPEEFPLSTFDVPGAWDIENATVRALIHTISLEDTGVMADSAWAYSPPEQTLKRSLSLDDRAGVEFLYPFPDTATRTGALSGTVAKQLFLTTVPVFGAQVVAVRQPDGEVFTDVSVTGGEWRIDVLPPGDYSVYVEPFDGPYYPTMVDDGIYGTTAFDTTIQTHFAGGDASPTVFSVAAGGEVGGVDIVVPDVAAVLNPRWVGRSADSATPFSSTDPLPLVQGESLFMTVTGPGIDLVPDDGVSVAGSGVTVSSSAVARGTDRGDPYMIVSVSAAADAAPGVRSVFVDDGSRIAALTGAIDVMPSQPLPGLLRNDEIVSLAPLTPDPAGLLPLDPFGPDNFPGNGEGTLREEPGSDDDDDLYVPEVPSGYLDPDLDVLTDASRPLVFYRLTDPNADLRLEITPSGRIRIVY